MLRTGLAKILPAMKPVFFATPSALRAWLARNHATRKELWAGFYKKSSGKPNITWPEAVDAVLCFGWIDGVRKSIDETSYAIRLTPRKPRSTWSTINIKKVEEMKKPGLMQPAGLKAFELRMQKRSGIYSYEQKHNLTLEPRYEKKLRANKKAYTFFRAQPSWYQRTSTFWVMSAMKEETRETRLVTLIACSAGGRSIKPLTRPGGAGKKRSEI
jgi:uncharacterized protein YdeI (YjbR/CyaY-like superfamily)